MKSNAILLDLFFDIKRTTTARWVCSQAQGPCVSPLQGTTGVATSTTTPPSSPLLSSPLLLRLAVASDHRQSWATTRTVRGGSPFTQATAVGGNTEI